MEINELKDWMDEKFEMTWKIEKEHYKTLNESLEKLNGKVMKHEKWLNYIRGAIAIILLILGYLGLK